MTRSIPLLLMLSACASSAPSAPEAFRWLVGAWSHTDGATVTLERWQPGASGVLLGTGVVRMGDRVLGYAETLAIIPDGDHYSFIAWPVGQNPMHFTLRQDGPQAILATRTGHGFPQNIRYAIDAKGALEVQATGTKPNQDEHWTLTRVVPQNP